MFGFRDERHYFMADMGSHTNESVLFREIGDNGSVSLFDYRNQEPVEADHWYDVRMNWSSNWSMPGPNPGRHRLRSKADGPQLPRHAASR